MPAINPQTFFRFAADHHELLAELYQRRDGITEAALLALIRQFDSDGGPSAAYLVERLRDLGFIDNAPHATAQYEMTRPFAELMASLLRDYHLTSVEVIRGYFIAMDGMAAELTQANADKNGDMTVRVLKDAARHIERMRNDSRTNRDEIVATAMRVKSNKERLPPQFRYETINRLWNLYLVPLRDMIDTRKAMDASLDRMERALEEASSCFETDGAVAPSIEQGRARARRLRRDVVLDFRESLREIAPLYEELRRENLLARGASHALETIHKRGMTSLKLPERLGICNWQQHGLLSDEALRAYLLELRGYTPRRPSPIRRVTEGTARDHVRLDDFDAKIAAALPIEDALRWIAAMYPAISLTMTLRLYGRMRAGRYGARTFGTVDESYSFSGAALLARPMRLDKPAMVEKA